MPSWILHLDVDAFAVAVERAADSSLRKRPVLVGQEAGGRGHVACASYEARALGIRSGMPLSAARRRAPGCPILPGNPREYERASSRLLELLTARAPLAEAASLDDFFLDLTGCERLFGGDLLEWGRRLACEIEGELSLPVSFGIGSNKMVARVATRLAKPGHGIRVQAGQEREFLAPLPVKFLPGVGQGIRQELKDFGVRTVGQMAALGEEQLRLIFGSSSGSELWRRAGGECHEAVKPTALHQTLSCGHAFTPDTADRAALEGAAVLLAQRLAWNLRRHDVRCQEARLELTYSDNATASRMLRLPYPSNQDTDLAVAARQALQEAFRRRVRVRSLRITAPFEPDQETQFDFFQERQQRRSSSLYEAIDGVRAKHGFASLVTARALIPPPPRRGRGV